MTLQPGLHLVRRDDHHLQVGVDPPWRLVVPDQPEVRRLIDDLAAGRSPAPASPAAHRVLRELAAAGMLVEHEAHPTGAVSVEAGSGPVSEILRLLGAAGCRRTAVEEASVALVVADGEVRREVVDDHQRAGRPHLPVAVTARGHRLGPFVVPGVTACVRCVDAHLGELDPRRALVIEQLGDRAGRPDPVLATMAAAWAVRDLATWLSGGRPSTWSTTVEIERHSGPVLREWTRHPHCGCSWQLLNDL